MRDEAVAVTTMPDKPGKPVKKKDQVTVEVNLKRGIDVAYLDKIGVSEIVGVDVLFRTACPLTLTLSTEDYIRLRKEAQAVIVKKIVKEEK